MKIALVSSGLGRVWRGYERYTQDLYDLVRNDLEITLLKGGGKSTRRERSFGHLRPDGSVATFLRKFGRDPYFISNLSYALRILPHLAALKYDVVHYSEPGLGNILSYLKRKLNLGFKLLFSNGIGLSPSYCTRADYLHQLTDPYYQEALDFGLPAERLANIPYGLHAERFLKDRRSPSRRGEYGIPEDKIVVLSVSALNRTHKRIDYLIGEIERLNHQFFLLVCGNPEDPSLVELADRTLPGRHKFISVPFDKMPEIYRLSDVLCHTALIEGFCLALVEAMCAELPVVAHHAPHFEWLIGNREDLVDMSKPGALAEKLHSFSPDAPGAEPIRKERRRETIQRFEWKNLKSRYISMYRQAHGVHP